MSLLQRFSTVIVLTLLLSTVCRSQSLTCDSGAVSIGTFTDSIALSSSFMSLSGTGQLIWDVGIMLTGSGQINYQIDLQSIHVAGDGSALDAMTTPQIFDLMAEATVVKGIAILHTPCPEICNGQEVTRVSQPACVARTGSGSTTQFASCSGSGCCTRIYNVCCPESGPPVITLIDSESDGCGSISLPECESTCPEDNSDLSESHAIDMHHRMASITYDLHGGSQ